MERMEEKGGMMRREREEEGVNMGMRRVVVAGDFHVPFEDEDCVDLFIEFLSRVKPGGLVLNGDIGDFYILSRFDKSPERILGLQGELDGQREMLRRVRGVMPEGSWIELHEGNHDKRLQKWVYSHPEVASLRVLQIPYLLGLEELRIGFVRYKDVMNVSGYVVHHGVKVRSQSGYTARANVDDYGVSVITNHTHRFGRYYKRVGGRLVMGIENGCMCRLDPEYVDGAAPNWHQGFGIITEVGGVSVYEEVHIIGGILSWRDMRINVLDLRKRGRDGSKEGDKGEQRGRNEEASRIAKGQARGADGRFAKRV